MRRRPRRMTCASCFPPGFDPGRAASRLACGRWRPGLRGRHFTCSRARCIASACEPDAGELPARVGWEEVAVRRPYVPGRGGARAATQHVLAAHELAVVLAN